MAGLVLLVLVLVLVLGRGETVIAFVAGAMILSAVLLRVRELRGGNLSGSSWPLTIVALFMPMSHARSYLEELGAGLHGLRGRRRWRHTWNAITRAPGTLATTWQGWLRAKLVALVLWALCDRVRTVLEDMVPQAENARQCRRLRLYCRLILCATGSWQFDEFARPARALLRSCRRSMADGGGPLDPRLDAQLREEADDLVRALASSRPGRA